MSSLLRPSSSAYFALRQDRPSAALPSLGDGAYTLSRTFIQLLANLHALPNSICRTVRKPAPRVDRPRCLPARLPPGHQRSVPIVLLLFVSSSFRHSNSLTYHPLCPQVTYHTGSALDPSTFSHLLPESTAVVHTLGILLEGDYKGAVRGEAGSSLLGTAARMVGVPGMGANPLEKRAGGGAGGRGGEGKGGYERVNRDSGQSLLISSLLNTYLLLILTRSNLSHASIVALSVLRALLASKSTSPSTAPAAPFVYISAEDIFRPFVPAGYIASKRQAEHGIEELVSSRTAGEREVTPLIVRPGMITFCLPICHPAPLAH